MLFVSFLICIVCIFKGNVDAWSDKVILIFEAFLATLKYDEPTIMNGSINADLQIVVHGMVQIIESESGRGQQGH